MQAGKKVILSFLPKIKTLKPDLTGALGYIIIIGNKGTYINVPMYGSTSSPIQTLTVGPGLAPGQPFDDVQTAHGL